MTDQQLFQFAFIPKYEDAINALASMADPEDWDFSDARVKKNVILKNYIEHTFRKVREEEKIAYSADNKYACFNTGKESNPWETRLFLEMFLSEKRRHAIEYF